MNEQTAKLIQELADKLGTTAEHLWGVLIAQAPISAWVDIIVIATLVVMLIAFSTTIVFGSKRLKKDSEDWFAGYVMVIFPGILSVFTTITAFAVLVNCATTIAGFINPEYWALQQILK